MEQPRAVILLSRFLDSKITIRVIMFNIFSELSLYLRHMALSSRCAAGILVLVALAISWNSLNNPFLLDDESKIVKNADIRHLSELPDKLIYPYDKHQRLERNDPSRPLVFLVYALIYSLGELNPVGYHLTSVIFHWACAFLLFLLTQLVLTRSGISSGVQVPALGASIAFLVVPIQMGL